MDDPELEQAFKEWVKEFFGGSTTETKWRKEAFKWAYRKGYELNRGVPTGDAHPSR